MTWLFLVLFFSAADRPFPYEFELPTWDACEAERAEMAGWYGQVVLNVAAVSERCWARLPGV